MNDKQKIKDLTLENLVMRRDIEMMHNAADIVKYADIEILTSIIENQQSKLDDSKNDLDREINMNISNTRRIADLKAEISAFKKEAEYLREYLDNIESALQNIQSARQFLELIKK